MTQTLLHSTTAAIKTETGTDLEPVVERSTAPDRTDLEKVDAAFESSFDAKLAQLLEGEGRISRQLPLLIHADEVPGKLCLKRLEKLGIFEQLDERTDYLTATAASLYGRAKIATRLVPHDAAACLSTAHWVWMGGPVPTKISIITEQHVRGTTFGRTIRVYNRQISDDQLSHIGRLTITTPLRTAAELACLTTTGFEKEIGLEKLADFLQKYEISIDAFENFLENNKHWPGHQYVYKVVNRLRMTIAQPALLP